MPGRPLETCRAFFFVRQNILTSAGFSLCFVQYSSILNSYYCVEKDDDVEKNTGKPIKIISQMFKFNHAIQKKRIISVFDHSFVQQFPLITL